MKSREFTTKFDCPVNVLLDHYFSNEELVKQMPFKKFSLVSLFQQEEKGDFYLKDKLIKRRFLLNVNETKIPEFMKSFLQDKKIEWEETVIYSSYTKLGSFKVELVDHPNLNSKFTCYGDIRFQDIPETNKSKRLMTVNVDVAAPWILKNTLESFILDEIWLMIHHEAEVVNDDIVQKE